MVARLWANELIGGNKTFEQVPALLKKSVEALLIKEGREDLIMQ